MTITTLCEEVEQLKQEKKQIDSGIQQAEFQGNELKKGIYASPKHSELFHSIAKIGH